MTRGLIVEEVLLKPMERSSGSDQVTDGNGNSACIQILHMLPQMGDGIIEQALHLSEGASAHRIQSHPCLARV
jgi:hypothetical protein